MYPCRTHFSEETKHRGILRHFGFNPEEHCSNRKLLLHISYHVIKSEMGFLNQVEEPWQRHQVEAFPLREYIHYFVVSKKRNFIHLAEQSLSTLSQFMISLANSCNSQSF